MQPKPDARRRRRVDLKALAAVDPDTLYATPDVADLLGRGVEWAQDEARRLAADGRAVKDRGAYLVPGREVLALAGGLLRLAGASSGPAPSETANDRLARARAALGRLDPAPTAATKRRTA